MAGNEAKKIAEHKPAIKGTCAQFLRENPRFLNEPIRYLLPNDRSKSVAECLEWIKDKDEDRPTLRPSLQLSSDQPKVAQPNVSTLKGHVNREPACGIAPGVVTNNKGPFKEKISFRHGYNCRADPNEPIRGKLHGNFVWAKEKECT